MNEINFGQGVPATGANRKVAWVLSIIGLISMVLLCVGAYGTMNAKEVIVVEPMPAALAAPVAQDPFAFQAASEQINWSGLGWLVGIILGVIVFYKVVIETGFWKIILGVGAAGLVVGALFWILLYRGADVSTPDARDANLQVVKVVQPIGDPNVDEVYSNVNRQNAGTNIVNAGGVAIYMVLFFVGLIVVGGLLVFGHYYINR